MGSVRAKVFLCSPPPVNDTEKERTIKWMPNTGTGLGITTCQFIKKKVLCKDNLHQLCFVEVILHNFRFKSKQRKALVEDSIQLFLNIKNLTR